MLAIYGPIFYMAQYVMLLMRETPLRGQLPPPPGPGASAVYLNHQTY
jgi:hypothetical protein